MLNDLAESFDFFCCEGDFFAETACAVGCDEVIFFVTDTSEVTPFFEFVVVDEIGEALFGLPHVDEFGYEVHSGFDGEHESFFKRASEAERLASELGALGFAGVTDIYLAEVLHIVHVKAHHVAEAALEEHGVRAGCNGFGCVAFGDSEGLEAVENHA